MTSQSILMAGVKSPARAFMRPTSSRSILKRPAPLPLSPNPFPFAASFSVVLSSSKLSPHVHFPASPVMAATFTAHSANTYDRAPIVASPASPEVSTWVGKVISPSGSTFKLANPPKRTSAATNKQRNLTVPTYEDPRSPKPYRARVGVHFDELVAQVPRRSHGAEDLAKALSTYPRSPYPSAPITAAEEEINAVMGYKDRGRSNGRWPSQKTKSAKPAAPPRARSLENKQKRRQNVGLHVSSPLKQNFLSPVNESPRLIITKPAPLNLDAESPESSRLSQAFWQSVSLEEDSEISSASSMDVADALKSPAPPMMFGNKDGSLWSPRLPKKEPRGLMTQMSMLSPAQRIAFSKGMVASPSPNDPFAAFPSFSIALSGMDGIITYPPRALVELD